MGKVAKGLFRCYVQDRSHCHRAAWSAEDEVTVVELLTSVAAPQGYSYVLALTNAMCEIRFHSKIVNKFIIPSGIKDEIQLANKGQARFIRDRVGERTSFAE